MGNKDLTKFSGLNETVVIPEGVKRILPSSLTKLRYARELILPSTLEYFTPYAILDLDTEKGFYPFVKKVHIENNDRYTSVIGVLYSKDMKSLIYMPPLEKNEAFEIPDGIEEIAEAACALITGYNLFWSHSGKEITFPKSLRKISKNSFYGVKIKSIEIPSNITLSEGSFEECNIDCRLNIGNEIIPERCFINRVKNVRLYDTVKEVKKHAFSGELKKIYISPNTKLDEEFLSPLYTIINNYDDNGKLIEQVKKKLSINTIIGGKINSYAHKYAEMNNIKFQEVENNDADIEAFLYDDKDTVLSFSMENEPFVSDNDDLMF